MPPKRKSAATSSDDQEGGDDEYRKKRERNNLAVKRCRIKSSQKAEETKVRVDKLKTENDRLEEKIKNSKKHVEYLKDLLLRHNPSKEREDEIKRILEDES